MTTEPNPAHVSQMARDAAARYHGFEHWADLVAWGPRESHVELAYAFARFEHAMRKKAEITPEMRRLIVAARVVSFTGQSRAAMDELDQASEAFAEAVPWDDEPDLSAAISTQVGEDRNG